jgi:hypothetical protein
MSKTAAKKPRRSKTTQKPMCKLIQWERKKPPVDVNGNPVCPECGEPAEMVLGLFAQPCWAHKE